MKKFLLLILLFTCCTKTEIPPQGHIVELCFKDGLAHATVFLLGIQMDYPELSYVSLSGDTIRTPLKSKNKFQVVDIPVGEGGMCNDGLVFKLTINGVIKDKKSWNCPLCGRKEIVNQLKYSQ